MRLFKYRILNHILFWIFIYAFYAFPTFVAAGISRDLLLNVLYVPFDMITVYIVIGYLIPKFLFKNRKLLLFMLFSALVISANITLAQYIKYNIQPALGWWVVKKPLYYDIFYWAYSNFMIVGLASAMKLLSYSYRFKLSKSEMDRKTVQSELGVLRSQVNPHFLFNVLNNIDSLIFEDKEKASNAIFLLSKIMRYMLQESPHESVGLDKELNYIKDYLELAKLSFDNPDFLEYECIGNRSNKHIPPLLFIPIIENAIKHCNKRSQAPGVRIEFKIGDSDISLKTFNYQKPNDLKLPKSGGGNGLKIVEKRLKLLHGNNYTFNIEKDTQTFTVHLKVPLK